MNFGFEILQGDCIERIHELAKYGRKFDAVVADPPYCSGASTPAAVARGGNIKKYSDLRDVGSFNDVMSQRAFCEFNREWLCAARSVLKSPGYLFVFIDWRQLPTVTDAIQAAGYVWRGICVWNKKNSRPNPGHFSQQSEFICWATADAKKSNKVIPKNVFECAAPRVQDRIHPTQKEPTVIAELLKILPDDAEAVLDPFSGSGSTGVAALSLGLSYTGIEEQEYYCEVSKGRLQATFDRYVESGVFTDMKRADKTPKLF